MRPKAKTTLHGASNTFTLQPLPPTRKAAVRSASGLGRNTAGQYLRGRSLITKHVGCTCIPSHPSQPNTSSTVSMASSGYGQAQPDPTRGMIAHTKTLLNAQLKQVLSAENLKVSGVKTDLQIRIISRELHLWYSAIAGSTPTSTSGIPTTIFVAVNLLVCDTDIERLAHQGDYDGIQRVRRLLYGPYQDYSNHSSPSTSYTNHYTPPSSASPQYPPPMPTYGHRGGMPPYNSYSSEGQSFAQD